MEAKETWQSTTKVFLLSILDKKEAEEFGDLSYALSTIKQNPTCFQAVVSVGVHAAILHRYIQEDDAKSRLQSIIGLAIEPLEESIKKISSKNGEDRIDDEQARLLFHTRFSLGTVLLVKSVLESNVDLKTRSMSLLREMASTRLSITSLRDFTVQGGKGIVQYHADMGRIKTFTAVQLFFILPEIPSISYSGLLYFICMALPYAELWLTALTKMGVALLDLRILELETFDTENKDGLDFPTLEWLDLFAAYSEILSAAADADTSGTMPNKCSEESPQYMAWKFGQMAGRFTNPGNRWQTDPFGSFFKLSDDIYELSEYIACGGNPLEYGLDKTTEALNMILSLLSDFDLGVHLSVIRERYTNLWSISDTYVGIPMKEIGPHMDLYWAMKIGFVDACIKHTEPSRVDQIGTAEKSKMWNEIWEILAGEQKGPPTLPREEVLKLVESEESAVLEFKASIRRDAKGQCDNDSLCLKAIKTVAAFLNGQGGRLLIGVADDHEIVGLSKDYQGFQNERDQYEQFIVNKIGTHIGTVEYSQYVSITFCKIGKHDICLLDIKRSAKPIYVKERGQEDFYIRTGNETRKLNIREAIEYQALRFPKGSS